MEAWVGVSQLAAEDPVDADTIHLARLRPENFLDYIGQSAVKENLKLACSAAARREEPLDHCLFHGPPGLGKTSLAQIVARALGVGFKATSGPGMDLKTEIMGLATIAELPLVILNVQRGGPSTGLPTKAEQSDLFQACFSAHGDVLRPVLAPISVGDTFRVTVEAFNLAERYQTPVIILSDQEIAQRKETVEPIDTSRFTLEERLAPSASDLVDYRRFRLTVFPLALSVPWGLTLGPLPPYLPWPSRILIEALPAIHFPRTGDAAAADDAWVTACAHHVEARMQAALTRLAAERAARA